MFWRDPMNPEVFVEMFKQLYPGAYENMVELFEARLKQIEREERKSNR